MTDQIFRGLDGVTVDTSNISHVIPELSALTYRGYPVDELAHQCSFEETAYLLWYGELPNAPQLEGLSKIERSNREISDTLTNVIRQFPKSGHPMDALRTAVSFLGMEDPSPDATDTNTLLEKSIKLWAQIPTIVAYVFRARHGKEFRKPRSDLSFSENFFHMCFDENIEQEKIRAFDASMTLYAEHSFNASTFTARVITSSLADIYGAVTGGIASLKGPLHGGANEAVMHMLLEVDKPEKAREWMLDALKNKRKVMGFGHRVYKTGDSRVPTMKEYFRQLAQTTNQDKWVEISDILEDVMVSEKNIYPNLDFPAGPAYYLMDFDIDFFTPFFVMSRITGWTTHIIEQMENNRLIRPLSAYTGHGKREVTKLDQR